MKKKYIVKTNQQFNDIIKKGLNKSNKYYIIYYNDNELDYDRFGVSVSKKLGNAVFRNKYKRKLRSILDDYKKMYINQKDYIIILRKGALNREYVLLKKELFNLINSIEERDKNEKK